MKAVLFDMDGVLVDVSRSYRTAIIRTIEYFLNMTIGQGTVQAYKNQGSLNNDWDLTEFILKEKGMNISKAKIIEVFQSFYLGSHFNGLIENETWLLDRPVLEKVKASYAVGIVTGRPSRETDYALQRFGFAEDFPVRITMDDIPRDKNKPHPQGILLAQRRLKADLCFYLGDTVDDMTAARRAGAVPIGIVPPGHDPAEQEDILRRCGARQVLTDVNRIKEVLF